MRVTDDPGVNQRQLDALTGTCDRIIQEPATRRILIKNRPALCEAVHALGPGDSLVVERVQRLGDRLTTALITFAELDAAGIHVTLLTGMGTYDEDARENALELGRFEQSHRAERLTQRIKSGQAHAKDQGTHIGRPAKIDQPTLRYIQTRRWKGESIRAIARDLGVSPTTVSNVLKSNSDRAGSSAKRRVSTPALDSPRGATPS